MHSSLTKTAATLRDFAFALPEAWEDHPWGESVAKVGKKVFVFFGHAENPDGSYGISVKLPISAAEALAMTTCAPTGYGLGKAGWMSITLAPKSKPDLELLCDWIEESYRAIAPKKLIKLLDAGTS